MIRSRLAPTPSGYLHLGNAVNFVTAWLMVRAAGGKLKLRIDDADSSRSRPAFVEDIFVQLAWLGLDWDEGPSGPDDFYLHHSQLLRIERYRQLLAELDQRWHLYRCRCSRKEIQAQALDGLYPGTCRSLGRTGDLGLAIRVHVPEPTLVAVDGITIPLCRAMGDFVLWRKEDLPAYQLASLVDDLDDRITLIVRGADLRESTAAQRFLADRLQAPVFAGITFHHHPLITCPQGRKLSKSDNALSLQAMRQSTASPAPVYQAVAQQLGLDAASVESLADLLTLYRTTIA